MLPHVLEESLILQLYLSTDCLSCWRVTRPLGGTSLDPALSLSVIMKGAFVSFSAAATQKVPSGVTDGRHKRPIEVRW